MALLSQPTLDASVQAIAWQGTVIDHKEVTFGFFRLTDLHGQHSYLPAAACLPQAVGSDDAPFHTEVVQPINLYRQPQPGSQYLTSPDASPMAWLVLPQDPLILLGYEQNFALIQRADGRVGYIPTQLCTTVRPNQSRQSFDASSALLGIMWCVSQALILPSLLAQAQLTTLFELWYLRSMLITALFTLLWFAGSQRVSTRSFAIGIAAAYLLIEAGAYLLIEFIGKLTVV